MADSRRGGYAHALVLILALWACGDDPAAVVPRCGAPPELAPDEPRAAALSPDDGRRGGAHTHYYTVHLAALATIGLEMTSADIDPLLYLFDDAGRVRAHGFDPDPDASPSVARLSYVAAPGCYVVGASSWTAGATGTYTILLTLTPP